ncbi:MAG: cytochrome c maturation protein CcmE [Pseudomonadota bacterium]|nr:cytochrome c maturation protein CcmE [Pseudomonadota bacterium]|tara:strand:+ start:4535 stop:4993 length:459 start_codon:yes stop_codon:yes gene_type:complete
MILNKRSKKRIKILIIFILSVSLASGLIIYALSKNMIYFYTPTQVINGEAPLNTPIRLGGMVMKGSLDKDPNNLNISFYINDSKNKVLVNYKGLLPDLFGEGQGVVVSGVLNERKNLQASEVLAKHDENYMPPEVADMMNKEMIGINKDDYK